MDTQTAPLLHDIPGATRRLSISRSVLFELIKRGDIKIVKIGRRTYVPEASLIGYVESLGITLTQKAS